MVLEPINEERVLIVGVELETDFIDIKDSMDELEELVYAAGGKVLGRIIQKKKSIDPAYFIGRGKAIEIKNYCEELNINTVVFNDELSGAQLRNLEDIIDKKIIDRTNLILDIFATRATSKEGKLQVKLAQLKYRLPRLVGLRDYLSREGGGIGTRGPGEQKLETDRRHIVREIKNIENALKEAKKNRDIKRKRRQKSSLPIVALVGYTNAGKSTLLNRIIEMDVEYDESKKVFEYDMFFATLDTSLRRGRLPNGQSFLITDTVGFVNKLPTHLIEAFKGTLEEIKYADLILHVVDVTNSNLDLQIQTTMDILKELDVIDKPIITVFNKIDKTDISNLVYDGKYVDKKIFISSKEGTNLDKLLKMIQDNLPIEYKDVTLLIPYDAQNLVNYFLENYKVSSVEYSANGTKIRLNISLTDYNRYSRYVIKDEII
ncbi:GTPase HflX [Tepidimicrobium xylanilyticum]|uniref:GTPase HflX n=1 Tax=Tepidimicrobium xylanilyticum TaxID=1123352 RepID=A0A1H2STW6_9FIRM|nr:GTPase HflX [Tepidimicrobium xylanilyticum]GMG96117.1 GTPase HflX [Tepidimicrobium xylanilyticum]SDW35086.1 GTP-binding protein HflX [Tepidimicrobium xylanilyticum]